MSERPYWFPVLCDEDYFARLRVDYPENAYMSDEELHAHYVFTAAFALRHGSLWWNHLGAM